jgi:putative transposase
LHQKKGYQKLRKGRRSLNHHFYLITTQIDRREPILAEHDCAQLELRSLKWMDQQDLFLLDTAVVMPDHVHFLGRLKSRPMDKIMQQLKSFTSKQIGIRLKRQGRIWQIGYHDHAVRKEEVLNEIRLYCLDNPVQAKLVDDFHDYPHWFSIWPV